MSPPSQTTKQLGWLERYRKYFEPGDLDRGRAYAHGRRVSKVVRDGSELIAVVTGTRDYRVSIIEAASEVKVACSCPRFQDGFLCKHIAAVFVVLDDAAKVQSSGAMGAAPGRSTTSVQRPQQWALKLDQVAAGLRHWESAAPKSIDKLWYVLELEPTLARTERTVHVSVYHETTRQPGKARILPQTIATESLPDPVDHHLVGLLRELTQGRWRWGAKAGRAELPHRLARRILTDLAATGRLVLQRRSKLLQFGPPMQVDPEPWRVCLHAVAGAAEMVLRGELVSGERRRPLGEVELVASGRLALAGESILALDPPVAPQQQWVLQQTDGTSIPRAQARAAVARLQTLPIEGILELDQELLPVVEHHQPRMRASLELDSVASIRATLTAVYDGVAIEVDWPHSPVSDPHTARLLARDLEAETRALAALEGAMGGGRGRYGGEWWLEHRQLQHFLEQATDLGWDVVARSRPVRAFGGVTGSLDQREGWFELHLLASFGGETEAIDAAALLEADELGLVELADGSLGFLPETLRRRIGTLGLLGTLEGGALRYRSAQALLLDSLVGELELRADRELQALWQRARQRGSAIEAADPPARFAGDLRPYQREGLGWLEATLDGGYGVCLADDMGLGKTVQVLALLARRHAEGSPRGPSLVVAPRSVVHNWIAEAAKFVPALRVAEYGGRDRRRLLEPPVELDLLVTTYALVRSDAVALRQHAFDVLIVDEAQHVKNRETQAHAALSVLRTNHRIALSGTPVENRLDDLWSVLELLNPGLLGRLPRARQVANLELDTVAKAVRPFLLRRTKAEVLKDLPERTEQTLLVEMEPAQRKVYDQLRRAYRESLLGRVQRDGIARSKIYVLEALLRLRQAACHPALVDAKYTKTPSAKLDLLIERLDELAAEGHKVLVFSQFTSLLSLVEPRLVQRKIGSVRLDGRTKNRAERVARFSDDPDSSVFLISLKAGGTGLNLTAASYVFLLDPWWNPAVEAQAIDRSHRIGQTRAVTAYRLVVQGTVEERILELQQAKRELADAILSADTSVARQLTVADLEMLLG
jgi:superfamily II DNA or RNA helicase